MFKNSRKNRREARERKARKKLLRNGLLAAIGVSICALGLFMFKPADQNRIKATDAKTSTQSICASDHHRCMEALRQLFVTHPAEEIRKDFYERIAQGEVVVNFDKELMNNGRDIATLSLIELSGRYVPLLAVNEHDLLSNALPNEAKQLIIYHEYIHYRQLTEGRAPAHTFLLQREGENRLTTEEAVIVMRGEVEAYREECLLAEAQQWTRHVLVCQIFQQKGENGIREMLAENYCRDPHWQNQCGTLLKIAADTRTLSDR